MAMPLPFDGFVELANHATPTCLTVFECNRYAEIKAEVAEREVRSMKLARFPGHRDPTSFDFKKRSVNAV